MDEKVCKGYHCQGAIRPLSEFYVHKSGVRKDKPFSRCKRCWDYQRNHTAHGAVWTELVPIDDFRDIILELVRRVGVMAAASRVGVAYDTITPRRLTEKASVRRMTYNRAVVALEEARANGEDGYDPQVVRFANLTELGRMLGSKRAAEVRNRRRVGRVKRVERKRRKIAIAVEIQRREISLQQFRLEDREDEYTELTMDGWILSRAWAYPDKEGRPSPFADFECQHGRLPRDKTEPCGCWPEGVQLTS